MAVNFTELAFHVFIFYQSLSVTFIFYLSSNFWGPTDPKELSFSGLLREV